MAYYVGKKHGAECEVFSASTTPTDATHGHLYVYVTGPFRTKHAATLCAAPHGPQLVSVGQFERYAKSLRMRARAAAQAGA